MKTLIASAILLSSTSVLAHDSSFSSDSCDVDIHAGLRINNELIEFSKKDSVLYQIKNNETLIVGGKTISLSSKQQALISDYSTSIRNVVPEVKTLAVDAINLAVEGVDLAFTELLGENNDLGHNLTTQLFEIRDEVQQQFDPSKEIYIDEDGHLDRNFFGEEFEQRIELLVEETVQNSLGSILIAVGQELVFAGGDMDAFAVKMENFGAKIEHEIESRAESLEGRSEALCYSIQKIDQLESQLSEEITELSEFDLISTQISNKNKA